ncbi:hypothetical protein [Sinorhizobium terangae]|uniref:hypothetical protein n=1 Tax=Sinorhizobium terangae TaxID=110322 RepID=UPI0024B216D1|nr:hypothetical protein [Sinorhizobium terangae]WFU50690.1 hypothetical protein QA637_18780 [Sinorhizobium terangae]
MSGGRAAGVAAEPHFLAECATFPPATGAHEQRWKHSSAGRKQNPARFRSPITSHWSNRDVIANRYRDVRIDTDGLVIDEDDIVTAAA